MNVQPLLQQAIAEIADPKIVSAMQRYLVDPRLVVRDWDYKENTQYPCWIVAVDKDSETAIAYCEKGFGPVCPWGLLNYPSEFNGMGPDYCWYSQLEDAFRQSMMWDGDNPPDYEVQ